MPLDTDQRRSLVTVVAFTLTVAVNAAAVLLPLNGNSTAEISARFPALVIPANYVFSIWSVIYLALLIFTVSQALPGRQRDERLRRIGYLPALTGLLDAAWVVVWHYELFALTVPLMAALLLTLVVIYRRLDVGRLPVPRRDRLTIDLPWSLYLGWITVATIANVTQTLVWLGFRGGPVAEEVWALGVLALGVVIAARVVMRHRDMAYAAVIAWAYAGIAVNQRDTPVVVAVALVGAATVVLLALTSRFRPGRGRPSVAAAAN